MSGQGNQQAEITSEEWEEMKSWLRPVLLSIVKSKKVLLEGVTFKKLSELVSSSAFVRIFDIE